jgi:hypothetical protein
LKIGQPNCMRYLNFSIQALLIATEIILALFAFTERDVISLFLIGQLILGIWQYGGSLVLFIMRSGDRHKLKPYLILSSCYLFLLSIFNYLFGTEKWFYGTDLNLLMIIIPSWVLAGYYFFITFKRTFPKRERGKFLRHVSF